MFTLSPSTAKSSHHHLHDPIFSPYLNNKEVNFVGNLGELSQKMYPFISNIKSPLHQMEKTEESGEIGVFGAEKYFHGVEVESPRISNIAHTKHLHKRDEQIETRKYKVHYGTPSILSESSNNSQSALLQSRVRNSIRSSKEKLQAKSVLASLGFKCSCSDKDSVDISDQAAEISLNKTTTHRKATPNKLFSVGQDSNHSLPKISMPNAQLLINNDVYFQKQGKLGVGLNNEKKLAIENHLVKMQLELDEEKTPRKSLEVFGSPLILNNKTKSLSIDKRLVFPSRNDAPKIELIDSNYDDDDDDDDASDASSDLFEIESFKGKSNHLLARQVSDAASSCVSPNCYAPSEASIEWSVVTASAAVMSDCEEQMSEITIRSPIRLNHSNGKPKSTKETQRRRPGTLLGCKNHKSVRVAGDAFITYEKSNLSPRIPNRINTSMVTRFPGESTRHGQHAYAPTPSFQSSSSSPHASKLLYI